MSETNETKETFGPFTLNTLCNTDISFKIPYKNMEFAVGVRDSRQPFSPAFLRTRG